ncbi:hypothetical protein D3C73_1248230 [compost metagenome]
MLKILDFRLPGCVMDRGPALCSRSRHHDVLCRPHTRKIEQDVGSLQLIGAAANRASVLLNHSTERFQPLQMQVDLPLPDRTSSRLVDRHRPESRQKRPHEEDGGAHLLHQLFRDMRRMKLAHVQLNPILFPLDFAAQRRQDIEHDADIEQIGNIP